MNVTFPGEIEVRDEGWLLIRAKAPNGDTIVLNLDMPFTNRLVEDAEDTERSYTHNVEIAGQGPIYSSLEGADSARVFADLLTGS